MFHVSLLCIIYLSVYTQTKQKTTFYNSFRTAMYYMTCSPDILEPSVFTSMYSACAVAHHHLFTL